MRAITIEPGVAASAQVGRWNEPPRDPGKVLVQTMAVGVCGTDAEILKGDYGSAPSGETRLIIGHESLGRVLEAPASSAFAKDDLVVPMVRWPDPVPCPNCAVGEWDMCRNGLYTEHGIKQRHGFAVERFTIEPHRLVKVDPSLETLGVLLEPASVVAKAWEHIDLIGHRTQWTPQRVLVTGAGPIGLLAAMMAQQRGFEVHVLDRVTEGPKPDLVRALGATYHHQGVAAIGHHPDVVLECTGVAQLVFDAMSQTAAGGIVCLTGISSGGRMISVDMSSLNKSMVLENDVVFGSVNANRRHYQAAAIALAAADRSWLGQLLTRRVPLEAWSEAFNRSPHDVKVVIALEDQR